MRLMLCYIRKHLGMFLVAVVFLAIETFADLLQPTFMSYIVDRGVKGADVGLIWRYGLIMLCLEECGYLVLGFEKPWNTLSGDKWANLVGI